MASPEPVRLTVDDRGVAVVELNRPEASNSIDVATATALGTAAQQAADARVIVLRSTGRFFCAGGDLSSFTGDPAPRLQETAEAFHVAVRALAAADAPVIARVQGVAAGAGLSLVAAADIAVAAEEASFVFAYGAAGLSPDGGASYFLPRRVGERRTFELALTNRRLDAATAVEWGLVNQVVPAGGLDAAVDDYVDAALRGSPGSLGAIKHLVATSPDATLDEQLDRESAALYARGASADGREGIAAFLAKRRPEFGVARP
ncbi:enoyl-CoA hydratase/isomerase family protein [Actinomycetospora termitidis]|uniref:Enoyl-CoA hydratase-related protein n=1 Tax=Actinomycetospora termitidis TaxID=3053470 RepID=A0ABT7MCC9_9PSEU|nr:enoyl-CoA hydratase-related protein [Actinomycetospora sp. Odt1-22]MDL5158329.1 enoyl-CoA hydratase-related protein [Actinomycetospora sp. Odt1-22]